MAGKDYGDVVISVLSGPLAGRTLSAMGEIKIKSTGYKVSAEVSSDHQVMNRGFEPQPVIVSCDFDRGSINWNALITARFDMTWTEVLAGMTHFMTQAGFTGEAQGSMKDGKMTGLEVSCAKANYRLRNQ
ncbi:hypothetical protein BOSE62_130667 [Bosea sp. 62]|uniref:hypothetical protein n=1 Tax=unclassified Bosea (in: a-proteobacteria) TaxID=2653178 RepID=UPI00125B047D|nr:MULTISPECIES: hypothetical protein [unclassified Bosea (in: a-proteobacteria)]CAD5255733.1 hypothetical protein BOSE7B_120687 [Bosea sp. 7B]CAD5275032.1 hypothetical protein BOSE21B_30225 [Bosea sp. 21B]CAD5276174.1 hypothetical protein BOSE46_30086 [Bosea sp. 46]VVT60036.1 hypothetical protein BOS5A_210827 [Bosea sp. EC-HK365B]VXB52545.1 hypothetical protein BOSE62_130667 [Bosea sp. 62]